MVGKQRNTSRRGERPNSRRPATAGDGGTHIVVEHDQLIHARAPCIAAISAGIATRTAPHLLQRGKSKLSALGIRGVHLGSANDAGGSHEALGEHSFDSGGYQKRRNNEIHESGEPPERALWVKRGQPHMCPKPVLP